MISELDVNPVKVGPEGCAAVDALVVPGKDESCWAEIIGPARLKRKKG